MFDIESLFADAARGSFLPSAGVCPRNDQPTSRPSNHQSRASRMRPEQTRTTPERPSCTPVPVTPVSDLCQIGRRLLLIHSLSTR